MRSNYSACHTSCVEVISVAYRELATVNGGYSLSVLVFGVLQLQASITLSLLCLRKKDRFEFGERKFLLWVVQTAV